MAPPTIKQALATVAAVLAEKAPSADRVAEAKVALGQLAQALIAKRKAASR